MAHDDQQLFERLRRHGDVEALGDLFDRVAPALLRLALHLSRDPDARRGTVPALRARARANWWEGNGERTWSEHMLPGDYEVTITSETGKQESTRFVVDANDRPDRRIAIKLP